MRTLGMTVWALVVSAGCHAEMLYESHFDRQPDGLARFDEWLLLGAQYEMAAGWLTVRSEKTNPYAALKTRRDGDCTFRATVRNSRECHWVALLAQGAYRLEINNQFVELRLCRLVGDEWKVVGQVGGYGIYPRNTQEFELRLVRTGSRVLGFIDDKLLVEYEDPEPVPEGGEYALMSGWGTDCAWRGVSLSDKPDTSQWPVQPQPKRASQGLVEVTWVRGLRGDSVYFDGERAGLTCRLKSPADKAREVFLSHRLIDIWQKGVGEKTETVNLQPGEERELKVEFDPPGRGCFKVALFAGPSADDLGWVEDLGSFTVVSRAVYDAPRDPGSYFGGHMDGINLQWHLEAGRRVGIQWARCHDMMQQTWWRRIQPDGPDQWIWFDDAQALIDGLGFSTSGEFLWTPKWASSAAPGAPGNPETYPPKNWDDLARYVRETVSHYKGSIHTWEVWNEPHFSGFWRGTAEDYAKLLQVCYTEAKRADPTCTVMGGGGPTVRQYDWIERVLEAGGGQYMDGFTIHYLEPDIADERMPKLRKLLDDHGMTGPIWDSEESVPSTSFFDQCRAGYCEPEARYHFRSACFELVRRYMENLSNGVSRIFYYDQADPWRFRMFPKARTEPQGGPVGGTMWDECRMYRPLAAAHAALALAIEGKTFKQRIERGDLRAFIFEGPDSATAVQYAAFPEFSRREETRLPIPAGAKAADFTIIDVMGNESPPEVEGGEIVLLLAREPVYVVYRGADAARVLTACYEG